MSTPQPPASRQRIASILWFPIFFAIALPVALGAAFHQPQPHNVPIAVVGGASQAGLVTDELHRVDAGGFAVRRLPSAAAAITAVHDREVAAAYVDEGPTATVYLARAAAPIRANYLQGVFAGIAAQAVIHLLVFRFEFESRGLGLKLQQCTEIAIFVAIADHTLHNLTRERGQGLGDAQIATCLQPEIEILTQQIRREGRGPIEIDEGRRLIFCKQ